MYRPARMNHRTRQRRALYLFALLASACAKSGDDDAEPEPLPAHCSGPYECTLTTGGTVEASASGVLVKRDGACIWLSDDDVSLYFDLSDPHATIDGRRFSFSGTLDGSTATLACVPGPSPTSSPSASNSSNASARCRGVADPCTLGNCYSQDGCWYSVGSAYTAADDECRGSSYSCDEYDSRTSCEYQQGCRWE